jgi:uncharacterized phage-associated protein
MVHGASMDAETVYDARSIAGYMLGKAAPRGLDALQTMKLTYIAHGFTLAVLDKPLLGDDIEAWKYGPAIRRLYSVLPAGQHPFTELLHPLSTPEIEENDKSIVDTVFEKYGKLSGLYLSTLTHRPGSPWHKTWTTYGQNAVIPKKLIHSHYCGILDAWEAAATANRPYSPDVL